MTTTSIQSLTLEEFLKRPDIDGSPAWEYSDRQAVPKPMPQTHHSRLQLKLAATIDAVAETQQIAAAFPELRCTFGDRSIVPDIVVLTRSKIPFNAAGESENSALTFAPNWAIEILSPQQTSTKVISNLLHCIKNGSRLGWLLDPEDRAVFVFQPQQELEIYRNGDRLPVLEAIALELTADIIFGWLKMNR